MNKGLVFLLFIGLLPVSILAQDDDMYFGSSKSSFSKSTRQTEPVVSYSSTYYSGSKRNVDEYNRKRGSYYETIPSDTGDVITFSPVEGVYPDSLSDFTITQNMQRWDDYLPNAAYWEGYNQGCRDSWGWHSPWYYYSYYPWYYSWYNPWYYDYGWSWHYPYYYYDGWYGGWNGFYSGHHNYAGNTGTLNRHGNYRSHSSGRVSAYTSSSRFDNARNRAYQGNNRRGSYSGVSSRGTTSRSSTRTTVNNSSNRSSYGSSRTSSSSSYGTNRSSSSYNSGNSSYGSSRSSSYSGSSRSSSSSSGSRSGGGRSGGGRR